MFRKLAFALATAAALGTAAIAIGTTPAEARHGYHRHHHGHHHHWRGPRFHGPAFAYAGCYVKRWVGTPWGPQLRWVNRCF